ncbi:hypothetical protein ACOBQX_28855 [Actinokineospora sp. G85]|uniref:hypothetical protein n=1 Tax=Actinokineospora sp. G85 TaxID=3406626 RepID=UPI003C7548A5
MPAASSSKGEAPDVAFKINLVDDAEAERLDLQQAAIIRDVLRCVPTKRHQRAASHERHLIFATGNRL